MVSVVNIFATWTCLKCKQSFRDTFDAVKEKGHVACGAPYEKLTHLPLIIFDSREQRSGVPAECEMLGCEVVIVPNLEIGDIIVSDRVAFERKAILDFLQDWIDNRELFSKLHDLKSSYRKPILLLEGKTDELFTARNIDPAKVRACLFTIARMGIPLIETINKEGTALALKWYAEKEQNEDHRIIQLHNAQRNHLKPWEQLEYIMGAFPKIGRGNAILLLKHFGTVENIINATVEEIQEIKGINKLAYDIKEVVSRRYEQK